MERDCEVVNQILCEMLESSARMNHYYEKRFHTRTCDGQRSIVPYLLLTGQCYGKKPSSVYFNLMYILASSVFLFTHTAHCKCVKFLCPILYVE